MYKIEIYQDKKKEWRWRCKARRNGKIVAESGEGYKRRISCIGAIHNLFYGDLPEINLPIFQDGEQLGMWAQGKPEKKGEKRNA